MEQTNHQNNTIADQPLLCTPLKNRNFFKNNCYFHNSNSLLESSENYKFYLWWEQKEISHLFHNNLLVSFQEQIQ